MRDPLTVALPHREVPAATSATDLHEVPAYSTAPLSELLRARHATDAHLVTYSVTPPSAACPRLAKAVLIDPEIRPHVEVGMSVLDWDDHANTGLLESSYLEDVIPTLDPQPTWWHRTRRGAHLIYVYDEPTDPTDAEALTRGLIARAHEQGFAVDLVWDWTRLYRLPLVTRDGTQETHEIHGPGPLLQTRTIPRVDPGRSAAAPAPYDAPLPPSDSPTDTEWHRAAKTRLLASSRRLCEWLFRDPPSPLPAGNRNTSLQIMAGDAIYRLRTRLEGTTPELIYSLFLPTIAVTPAPAGPNRDLYAETWKAVCSYWQRDVDRSVTEQVAQESLAARLLKGVAAWPTPPAPPPDLPWVLDRAIVASGRHYFVLQADGSYSSIPTQKEMLPSALKHSGLEPLIPLEYVDAKGADRATSVPTLLAKHAISVQPKVIPSVYDPTRGYLDKDQLHLGAFCRRDRLSPRFDPRVDDWLHALFGSHYAAAVQWIGLSLAFEEGPICALSLQGPPGVGKSFLIQGLLECVTPSLAATSQVFGTYQDTLTRTPWIVIDEGFNVRRGVADRFRALVAGEPTTVNVKYGPTYEVRFPFRVILAANNSAPSARLLEGTTTRDDLQAIHQRLLYLVLDDGGRRHIEEHGGRRYTQGWVKGDYVLARHFLALYHAFLPEIDRSKRFLVEGTDSNCISELLLDTNDTGHAADVIVGYLASFDDRPAPAKVRTSEVWDWYRSSPLPCQFTKQQLGRELAKMSLPGSSRKGVHHLDRALIESYMNREEEVDLTHRPG